MGTDYGDLVETVRLIAGEAGEAIAGVYRRRDFGVETKSDETPVTLADQAAHDLIVPALEALLDDTPVLSEESEHPPYSVRRRWRRYWLVDPLDGTREFIRRNDEFTVNIALVEDGKPVLGVVYVPVSGAYYLGVAGAGAFRLDQGGRRPIHTRAMTGGKVTVAVSRSHGSGRAAALIQALEADLGEVNRIRLGSSLKSCLVAEGAADLYPRFGPTGEWDTAAAQAVVEAAGGGILDQNLQPLIYNSRKSLINPSFFVVGDLDFDWGRYLAGF